MALQLVLFAEKNFEFGLWTEVFCTFGNPKFTFSADTIAIARRGDGYLLGEKGLHEGLAWLNRNRWPVSLGKGDQGRPHRL